MVALGCRLPSNLPGVGGTPQNTSLHLRFPAMFHLPANITVVVIKVVYGGREATVQPDEDWLTAVDATNAMLVVWPDTLGWGSILRVCPPRRKRQKRESARFSKLPGCCSSRRRNPDTQGQYCACADRGMCFCTCLPVGVWVI